MGDRINDKIKVILDKSEYRPGQTVSGYIEVTVAEATPIMGLHLRFFGEETGSYMDKSGTNRWSNQVITPQYISCTVEPELNVGSHQFIFSFVIPHDAPPSFVLPVHIDDTKTCNAMIAYYALASFDYTHGRLECTHEVKLYPDPPTNSDSPKKESTIINHSYICCFSNGNTSISATIDKSFYYFGDSVNLKILVDNEESKHSISDILAYIYTYKTLCHEDTTIDQWAANSRQTFSEIGPGLACDIQMSLPVTSEVGASMKKSSISVEQSVVIKGEVMATYALPFTLTIPITIHPAPLNS